jgi:hypothetical protein
MFTCFIGSTSRSVHCCCNSWPPDSLHTTLEWSICTTENWIDNEMRILTGGGLLCLPWVSSLNLDILCVLNLKKLMLLGLHYMVFLPMQGFAYNTHIVETKEIYHKLNKLVPLLFSMALFSHRNRILRLFCWEWFPKYSFIVVWNSQFCLPLFNFPLHCTGL